MEKEWLTGAKKITPSQESNLDPQNEISGFISGQSESDVITTTLEGGCCVKRMFVKYIPFVRSAGW